jgi:hypothetical protein
MLGASGVLGVVTDENGISAQQVAGTVVITVVDCSGNPVAGAVVQLQNLRWGGWTYTGPNGVATISGVPPGTYTVQGGYTRSPTVQGGYGNFNFKQTITVGAGGGTLTVILGNGCGIYTTTTTT